MYQGKKIPPPFQSLLVSRREELAAVRDYPLSELASIISDIGFRCDCCAHCCTREFNGHVLLMDEDIMRIRACEPEALEPVPFLDFCDQNGIYYTSGYTIRSCEDPERSCHFLEDRRCRIYDMRPSICRVYPYMLHKEPDERGNVDWRQISGLDRHGEYHTPISGEDALQSAIETKRFEEAVLDREISYLECTGEYFLQHGLRHVRKKFDEGLRLARQGADIEVMVYSQGSFERWVIKAGTTLQMTLSGMTKSGKKI